MPKYYLVMYDTYYPQGGMSDFSEPFNSLKDATDASVGKLPYYGTAYIVEIVNNIPIVVYWFDAVKGWNNDSD